jgi:hypothetical protein
VAQQALKDTKMFEATTPLACNTFPGKQELVKKIIGVYLILPIKVFKHIHLDLGQVGTPTAQGMITNPDLLERKNLVLGRSGVIIGRSGFNKRYQQMEMREFLASTGLGSSNLHFIRKKLSFCWMVCFTCFDTELD